MEIIRYGKSTRKILIIHGWMHSAKRYEQLAQNLSENYSIFVVNLPGFGGTKRPKSRKLLNYYTEELSKLISENDFELLIGHSLGGLIILRALNNPEVKFFNSIILANPAYNGIGFLKPLAFLRPINQFLFFLQAKLPKFIVRPLIKLVGLLSIRKWKSIDSILVDDSRAANPFVAAKLMKEIVNDKFKWSTDRKLKDIVIFRSEYDRLVNHNNIDTLQKDIGESEIIEFHNIGHTSVLEDYHKFYNNVIRVLQKNERGEQSFEVYKGL